ncbi:MAG: hypothetical protein AAF410_00395 [Pseudomonadota bacterium]
MAEKQKKESDIDWKVLKLSLIMLCICVIISGSLVGASYYFSNQMEKEFTKNKQQFQSISRRYLDIDQEEQLLLDYYPRFVKLYNKGIIGKEKRLNWIEALRQSGESVNIPSLRYSIESQSEFSPTYPVDYSGFKLYSSEMQLVLGLLHEGDLFNLLSELSVNAKGLFTVDECIIRRSSDELKFEKDMVNVNTICTMQWITINLPDGQNIEIL